MRAAFSPGTPCTGGLPARRAGDYSRVAPVTSRSSQQEILPAGRFARPGYHDGCNAIRLLGSGNRRSPIGSGVGGSMFCCASVRGQCSRERSCLDVADPVPGCSPRGLRRPIRSMRQPRAGRGPDVRSVYGGCDRAQARQPDHGLDRLDDCGRSAATDRPLASARTGATRLGGRCRNRIAARRPVGRDARHQALQTLLVTLAPE
jgi:hypothetical protein